VVRNIFNLISYFYGMSSFVSAKVRRHSGRVTPGIKLTMKKDDVIEQCLEPKEHWSDWLDYRDGFRYNKDRKHLRSKAMFSSDYLNVRKWNAKLKKLIFRRKARKNK